MSELIGTFLNQLKHDISLLASQTGAAGQRLLEMSQRIDVSDQASEVPLSMDREHGRLIVYAAHPVMEKLLNHPQRRRSDLLFIVSGMMSILNREEQDIEDRHEQEFHAQLLRFALEDSQGSWAGAV